MDLQTLSRTAPWRRGAAAASTLTLALALAACGDDSAATQSDAPLRVGGVQLVDVPEMMLKAAGEDDLSFTVLPATFRGGGPELSEAMRGDAVDIGQMTSAPLVFAQAGTPLKAVAAYHSLKPGDAIASLYVPPNSDIESVADLDGKRVATLEGTALQYTLAKILETGDLTVDDVEQVNLPPGDAVAAYRSGDVDAIVSTTPYQEQLSETERLLADGADITSDLWFVVATEEAMQSPAKVEQITEYVQHLMRASDWRNENPEEWTKLYAKATGLDEKLVQKITDGEDFVWVPIDDDVVASQQDAADVFAELGVVEEMDVSAIFDRTLNDELFPDEQ